MAVTDSETVAAAIADRVWRMHHLDHEETIDHMDREQFRKQVLELLKPIIHEEADDGGDA